MTPTQKICWIDGNVILHGTHDADIGVVGYTVAAYGKVLAERDAALALVDALTTDCAQVRIAFVKERDAAAAKIAQLTAACEAAAKEFNRRGQSPWAANNLCERALRDVASNVQCSLGCAYATDIHRHYHDPECHRYGTGEVP